MDYVRTQTESELRDHHRKWAKVSLGGADVSGYVDGGNAVWDAISEEVYELLGRPELKENKEFSEVATAQAGASMRVVGQVATPLSLYFEGCEDEFRVDPLVIKGLSMPFNISGVFLTRYGLDQKFGRGTLANGRKHIPLYSKPPIQLKRISAMVNEEEEEKGFYALNDLDLEPNCVTAVKVRNRSLPNSVVIVEDDSGDPQIHQTNSLGISSIPMATGAEKVHLKKGQRLASCRRVQERPVFAAIRECPGIHRLAEKKSLSDPKKGLSGEAKKKLSTKDKIDLLEKHFELKKHVPEKLYPTALKIFLANFKVFSFDGQFGKTDIVTHTIHIYDHPPIKTKNRRLNPTLKDNLKEQIRTWLHERVIEESQSPWAFQMVPVEKKNGKIRWCVDFRRLNEITIKDSFPLPSIEDNLEKLSKSTVFSTMDGAGAFHQVAVDIEDREKTAFATPFGLYHFKRMPFGLTNAPATYSRMVAKVHEHIPDSAALPFMDDTIVHSRKKSQHVEDLNQVFAAYRHAGLKLQPEKCHFFRKKVNYLGHTVSEKGIEPVEEYLKLLKEWPAPTTVTEIRSYLGKTGYYRRFIQNYAGIAAPLTNLTAKGIVQKKFTLNKNEVKAFETLKGKLLTAPILAYPDVSPEAGYFILDTDWSKLAIGAVLSQMQEALERVIAYGAKKLNGAELNYGPTKGELAAVLYFVQKYRHYLSHRVFLLRTDHQALNYLKTLKEPRGMEARWLSIISDFNFFMLHRAGSRHGNADALSRAPHVIGALQKCHPDLDDQVMEGIKSVIYRPGFLTDHGVIIGACFHGRLLDFSEAVASIEAPAQEGEVGIKEMDWKRLQRLDPVLKDVRKWVRDQQLPPKEELKTLSRPHKQYAALFPVMKLNANNILVRRGQVGEKYPGDRIALPDKVVPEVVRDVHLESVHQGIVSTEDRIKRRFHHPSLRTEIELYIGGCMPCRQKFGAPKVAKTSLQNATDAGYKWQKISIDFVGPLNPSSKGNTYLLTVKDCFTRWLEAIPTKSTSTATVVTALTREVFSRWGYPTHLHSDRGSGFTSENMKEIIKALGIRQTHTPAYNPQSNSVERAHKDLGMALRASYGNGKRDWEECLPVALQALRTARCRATGFTPQFLMTGQEQQMPLDLIYGPPPEEPQTAVAYLSHLRQTFRDTYKFCREKLGLTIARASQEYEGPEKEIQPGRRVWLFTPRSRHPGLAKKLQPRWTGPWNVTERISEVLVRIKHEEKEFVCGIDRLALIPEKQVITRESWDEDVKWEDFLIQDEFMEYDEDFDDSSSIPKLHHSEIEAPEVDEAQYSAPTEEKALECPSDSGVGLGSGSGPKSPAPPADPSDESPPEGANGGNHHEEVGEADFEGGAASGFSNPSSPDNSDSSPTPPLPPDATFSDESQKDSPLATDTTFDDLVGLDRSRGSRGSRSSKKSKVPEKESSRKEECDEESSEELERESPALSEGDFANSSPSSSESPVSLPRTPSPRVRDSSPGTPRGSSSPRKKKPMESRCPGSIRPSGPGMWKRRPSKANLTKLEDLEKRLLPSRKDKQSRHKMPGNPKKRGRPPKSLSKSIDPVEPKEGRYDDDDMSDLGYIPEDDEREVLSEDDASMSDREPTTESSDDNNEGKRKTKGRRPRSRPDKGGPDETWAGEGTSSSVPATRVTRRNPDGPKTTSGLKKKFLKVRALLGGDAITDLVTRDPVINRRGELRRRQESVKKKSPKKTHQE